MYVHNVVYENVWRLLVAMFDIVSNCVYRFWDMSYMQLLCCRNFIKS